MFLSHRSVKDLYTLLGTGKLKCIVGRQYSKCSVIKQGRGESISLIVPLTFWGLVPLVLGFIPFLCSEENIGKTVRCSGLEEWDQ